jgi:hypothetical protein
MSDPEPEARPFRRGFMELSAREIRIAPSIRRVATLAVLMVVLVGCTAQMPAPGSSEPSAVAPSAQLTSSPDDSGAVRSQAASAATTMPPDGVALPYPDSCYVYNLSARRCAYIAEWAAREAGVQLGDASIELLGDPACDGQPAGCSVARTTMFVVRVRVISASGESTDHPVFCGVGGETTLLCTEMPTIPVSSPTKAGYHDVPCSTEGGTGPCASPVPTIDPRVAVKAVPLVLPRVVVPIDHVGDYVIDLGDAILPNGILSVSSATLADDTRLDVLIPHGVRLEILGDDGKPLENIYAQGWRPGTEQVHARLVFTVEQFEPGATLDFTDVVAG